MKINKEAYFRRITGYKITNSHFELGSNLHISDYYYTKRLFYNSFYTNRFAFLIARYAVLQFKNLIYDINQIPSPGVKEKTITLLGYENYSELLVSNVRKMLNDYLKLQGLEQVCFNHEIYTKDGLFLKNPENIGKNIISIFPISTTFSTSVKIRNEVREILNGEQFKNGDVVFHNPIINCLIITNGNLENSISLTEKRIEYGFGWEEISVDSKIIKIKNFDFPAEKIYQKYFISLPTTWQKINECSLCYPLVKAYEKCLFETKADPVTPNLIFNYPKAVLKEIEDNVYNLFKPGPLKEPIVYRKHFIKHGNNFIYYIRAGVFLKKNKDSIENWLSIKKDQYHFLNEKNIVLITPSKGSNSGFVNMVNEKLFSETATIIQYNPSEDYLYNFKTFYTEILELADYIIFVDDILFTANTFSEINYYIKGVTGKKKLRGIDLCFTLINRAGFYNNKKLYELNENDQFEIHSYTSINVAPILHRKTYPYIKLTEKFKDLSDKSVLDEMRIHFKIKENDFKAVDLSKTFHGLEHFATSKALFQFVVLNEFNKIFYYDSSSNKYLREPFISNIFESIDKNSVHYLIEELQESKAVKAFFYDHPEYKNELKNSLYKICCSEPFIQFKNIRQIVFSWVLIDLKKLADYILSFDEVIPEDFFHAVQNGKPTRYSRFHEFKFLLKRGTKLKMNYIYSIEILSAIEKILEGIKTYKKIQYYSLVSDPHPLTSLFDDKMESASKFVLSEGEQKPIFQHQFIVYYIGLLQELIIEHESKALQTVINVKAIIDRQIALFSKNLKNNYDPGYINLLRMLVLENTFIFHSSSEKFLKKNNLKISLTGLNSKTKTAIFKGELFDFAQNYSFAYTSKMLSRIEKESHFHMTFKNDLPMFESFSNMLLLKSALISDRSDNGTSTNTIKQKIETILNYCSTILNIESGGAFFAVKYKNKSSEKTKEDDVTIVGEFYANSNNFLRTSDINSKSVLYHVFNGIKEKNSDRSLSSFELSYNADGNYVFIENETLNNDTIKNLFEIEEGNFQNFYYLRITQIKKYKSKKFASVPIAVLCFYDNIPVPADSKFIRFDPKRVRQLLLLRNDLTNFINNQLNNDSLRAYIEQQNQTIINKAITHSFDTYVNQYKRAVTEIDNQYLQNKFEILGTLILNKHLLLKFIAEFLKDNNLHRTLHELRLYETTINGVEFKKMITLYSQLIFNMELNNHSKIDIANVDLTIAIEDDYEIQLYEFFYRELIFEIFYNIRKSYNAYVENNRRLKIEISIKNNNTCSYLTVKNNLYNLLSKNKKTKTQLENSMYNRKEKKGISLINTISEILYRENCVLSLYGENFEIQIPINKNNI